MKIIVNGSLEAVRSKKSATDDIEQTLVFNIWTTPDTIGQLNTFYKKPIRITIEEIPQ